MPSSKKFLPRSEEYFPALSKIGWRLATFEDIRETRSSWAPGHFTDALINPRYMGDYDGVSSDATGSRPGFFSSFQVQTNGNPDVFGFRLRF